MPLRYREDKATQAAARFVELRGGERMSYMKLLKLLYLADREALQRWGRPITFDSYVSMDRGPVLSSTYNRICEEPHSDYPSYWNEHFKTLPDKYEVSLTRAPEPGQLSEAELAVIGEIFEKFGQMSRWQIVDEVHKLPEYSKPKGSSIPIPIRDILVAGGWVEDEAEEAVADLEAEATAEQLWS